MIKMIKSENIDNEKSQDNSGSSNNPQLLPESTVEMPLLEQQNDSTVRRSGVIYVKKALSETAKRRLKYFGIFLIIFIILCILFIFVGVPIIFMNSIALQRLIMFTHLGLPSDDNYFRKYEILPGLRNLYVSVSDLHSKEIISLGVWHLLPYILEDEVITDENFYYEDALMYSNRSIILYFHGTGEDRSNSLLKYRLFRYFFHVITFDYRSYADSSKNELSEDAVVNDCVQLYEWLSTKTTASIFIWGHSLGTALAARTVTILQEKNISQPIGLVLEAAFTKMSEELYVHPYGKFFAWLPWFEATVIIPLDNNGFVFDTKNHISKIQCPVMILCAEDDSIVPFRFGHELYEIAIKRPTVNTTLYYQFDYKLGYDHYFIYEDPFLPYFINYFLYICTDGQENRTKIETDST